MHNLSEPEKNFLGLAQPQVQKKKLRQFLYAMGAGETNYVDVDKYHKKYDYERFPFKLNYLFLRKVNKPKEITAVRITPTMPAMPTENLSFSNPVSA